MIILKANNENLEDILKLQYIAYQSEAILLNNYEIPPLKQSLLDIQKEYEIGTFLKVLDNKENIIGSVRAYEKNATVHIGKLMVHPKYQNKGIGTALLYEIENICPSTRYELFTSDKSQGNLRLYEKIGYHKFKEEKLTPTLQLIFLEKIL